jgi:hypothetical protein
MDEIKVVSPAPPSTSVLGIAAPGVLEAHRAAVLREAAEVVANLKEIRMPEIFRGCFGLDEDADGWIKLGSGGTSMAADMQKAVVQILWQMAEGEKRA